MRRGSDLRRGRLSGVNAQCPVDASRAPPRARAGVCDADPGLAQSYFGRGDPPGKKQRHHPHIAKCIVGLNSHIATGVT